MKDYIFIACVILLIIGCAKYLWDFALASKNANYSPVELFERVYASEDVFYSTCVVKKWEVWGFSHQLKYWVCSSKNVIGVLKYHLSDADIPHRFNTQADALSTTKRLLEEMEELKKAQTVVSFKQIEIE